MTLSRAPLFATSIELQLHPRPLLCGRIPTAKPKGRAAAVQVVSWSRSAQPDEQGGPNVMLLAVKVVMAASAVQAVVAQPAFARGWHERRHYRRLQDQYALEQAQPAPKKEVAVAQAAPSPAAQGLKGLQRSWRRAMRKAQRAIQGDGSYSISYSGRDAGAAGRRSEYGSGSAESTPLGWLFVALAAGAALYLFFGKGLSWAWGSRRRSSEGGRWVYDRSLGGKRVFVPDAPKPTRSLWDDATVPDSPGAAAASATAAVAAAASFTEALESSTGYGSSSSSSAGGAAAQARRAVVPEWWVPPNTAVYCSPSRKEDLQRQAKATLRELEDTKLQGLDYSLSSLLTLRTICQEGGGLQVRPRTENGRDAMLRAGVRAAMECAMEGSRGLVGGVEPPRFVSGLAHDLGVPDVRAVTITHAEVAAAARALLISAEAGYRAGDQAEIMLSLVKLAQLLAAFPLPLGSAEAELLAGSIQQQTSLDFRRAIFFNFGGVDPSRAPILAEMLGFNPELVMPQLLLQIQAAQQAEGLQLQQESQGGAEEAGGAPA